MAKAARLAPKRRGLSSLFFFDGGSGAGSRVDDSDARGVGLGEVTLAGEVVFDLDSDSQQEPPQHA